MRAPLLTSLLLTACTYQTAALLPGDPMAGGEYLTGGDAVGDTVAGDPNTGDAVAGDPIAGDAVAGGDAGCPPPVEITDPADGTTAQTGVTVEGICGVDANWIILGGDIDSTITELCTSGHFSAPVTFTPGDGPKRVTATQLNGDETCESNAARTFERKLCSEDALAGTGFPAGSGIEGDPWVICTADQLDTLANNNTYWSDYFRLGNDILIPSSGGVINMVRIGATVTAFTGHFDGDGHSVEGVKMIQTSDAIGMFGHLGAGASVRNLTLTSPVLNGHNHVGAVVGLAIDATLENLSVTNARVTGSENVGGIVGTLSGGSLINSSANGLVVNGTTRVGGLVGFNDSAISTATVRGEMSITGGDRVGGLVGSTAAGSTLSGASILVDCAPCIVAGNTAGGAVGEHDGALDTIDVVMASTGGTTAIEMAGNYGGGIAGYATGTIDFCIVDMTVAPASAGTPAQMVGGIAGWTSGTVMSSTAAGTVTGNARVGGLVGQLETSGQVQGTSTATVIAEGTSAGGLVGRLEGGNVFDSWSGGMVQAEEEAGGIVGILWTGAILTSYATGDVEALGSSAGGIAGAIAGGTIMDSYSLANVTAGLFEAGGIAGTQTNGEITFCHHAVGVLSASSDAPGGIVGSGTGGGNIVENCYFTGGYSDAYGGTAVTTTQMSVEATFSGWNFNTIWSMGTEFPVLRWQP